ncbi:MAG: 3'-5' exonuclease [Plesiomonas shigelloides]
MGLLQRLWLQHRFRHSKHAQLFTPPLPDEWVALDFETTGLNPQRAEIVAIGALRIRHNHILLSESLNLRLTPPASLQADSVVIHQLRHQDLQQGCSIEQALAQLLAFIGNRPLVGYHIRYDAHILNRYCRELYGFSLPHQQIEVSTLYHDRVFHQLPDALIDLGLDNICRHLGLPLLAKHDALNDALTAALIFLRLRYGSRISHPKV